MVNPKLELKNLERKLADTRNELYEAEDNIDERKEQLINDIEQKINTEAIHTELFTVRWTLQKT